MSNLKITAADLSGKGVIGLADTPGLATLDMQRKFDEIASDVIVPHFNELVDALTGPEGVALVGNACSKAEADAKIEQKLIEVGAGDMTKSTYDTNGNGVVDNSEKLGGELPSYYAAADTVLPKTGGHLTGNVSMNVGAGDIAGWYLRPIYFQTASGVDVGGWGILMRDK